MIRHRFALRAAFVLSAALPSIGHALTVRCVGNVSQLSTALTEANASTDTAFIIRVRTGTYGAAQAFEAFRLIADVPDQVIELSGGWSGNGGTCQTRTNDPSQTVLVGTAIRTTLTIGLGDGANSGSVVHVHGLTLRNPAGYNPAESAACLSGVNVYNGEMRVERLHLEQCVSTASGIPAMSFLNHGSAAGQALLTIRNVSLRDNSARTNSGMVVATYNNSVSRLSQLSITTSQTTDVSITVGGLHLSGYGNSTTYVSNSVVWGNDPDPGARDIMIYGVGIHFNRMHYGFLDALPGSTLASNNTPSTGDPGFVGIGNARLRADSILIDSGIVNPPGGTGSLDADGNTRVQGGFVDVGAFEATPHSDRIFANDFED